MFATSAEERWHSKVHARVGITLVLLVFLAIPTFFIILQKSQLVYYYLLYPAFASLGLWLMARGKSYVGSIVLVLSIYGVVMWLSWHIGILEVNRLKWWIIALLPWVMFDESRRITTFFLSALPVVFSFFTHYLPINHAMLLPAEQDFLRQILRVSVAIGAFSCIYFLRKAYYEAHRTQSVQSEFNTRILDAIPLPLIIKDGITLEYIFFNEAAQLTFDLKKKILNTNHTTFSPETAASITRVDHEVLKTGGYHVKPDETFLHTTGIQWMFRTYRIPVELKASERRLLIFIAEDLLALDLVTRRAAQDRASLDEIRGFLNPVLFHFTPETGALSFPLSENDLRESAAEKILGEYLEFTLTRLSAENGNPMQSFSLSGRTYRMFLDQSQNKHWSGLIIASD